jgi:mannan polymerase II complex MNN11 subunit
MPGDVVSCTLREVTKVADERAGYAVFLPNVTDYNLDGSPASWARVPALRHAMAKWPASKYIWYLDQHSLIMNPDRGLYDNIMEPERLELLLLKDKPVVPPDSVIKTLGNVKGSQIDLVMCQNTENLDTGSFIIRTGEWAKFFLDTWFDPLYRSYNFQKAETHALVSRHARYCATRS